MNYKKGFSLISFLLYLLLFSVVTGCMCHIITTLIIPSFFSLKKTQSIIAIHVATDFFVRDIKKMKNSDYLWRVMLPEELIWQIDNRNIGWSFSGNCLQRREGMYNGTWKEATTSIIAKGIASAIFTIEQKNNETTGVELLLIPQSTPQKPIICYVSLKKEESHEKQ